VKLNEEKVPVSVSLEQWLIEIIDHTCKTLDINRSQLVTRAVKHYCMDRIIKQNPALLELIYNHMENDFKR
jgi:metal-responsive CopG/Arc/MetJ family transcriptional regulator